jgi:lipoprotein NlpD
MSLRTLFSGMVVAVAFAGCASHAPAPVVDRGTDVAALPSSSASASADVVEVPPGHYLVKRGDNLLRISLDHGQDYREVAAWNKLDDPNKINAGQLLRVVPPEDAAVAVVKPVAPPQAIDTAPVAVGMLKREPKAGTQPYSDEALLRLQRGEGMPQPSPAKTGKLLPEEPPAEVMPAALEWSWPNGGKLIAPFTEANNKGIDLAGNAGDAVLAAAPGKVVYAGSGLRGYDKLVIVKHDATFLSAYAHNNSILVKEGQSVTRGQKIAEVGNTDADQIKLHFEIRRQGKPVDPLQYLPKR